MEGLGPRPQPLQFDQARLWNTDGVLEIGALRKNRIISFVLVGLVVGMALTGFGIVERLMVPACMDQVWSFCS